MKLFSSPKRPKRRGASRSRPQSRVKRTGKKNLLSIYRRKIGRSVKRIFFLVVLAILITGFFVAVFLWAQFSVQTISIQRADVRLDTNTISAHMEQYKGRIIPFVSKSGLETELLEHFPNLQTAHVEKEYPHTVVVTVEGVPVAFQWQCSYKRKVMTETGDFVEKEAVAKYYINERGYITGANPDETEAIVLEERDTCPEKIQKGAPLFAEAFMEDFFFGKQQITARFGQEVTATRFLRHAEELHYVLADGTVLWLDFESPFGEQLAKLERVVHNKKLPTLPLDHIDLRVKKRVYFAPVQTDE